jgi:hypothetical protein
VILRPLASISHPDFNDLVIHFSGRSGLSNVTLDISPLTPRERLLRILVEGRLRAFTMFNTGHKAVCFTESTRRGVQWLIGQRRYEPYGVAFARQTVFERGGGPALYVRGDEWSAVAQWPPTMRARATRFWPGAEAEGDESLAHEVSSRSEWLVEREWRALPNSDGDWLFDLSEVDFLVVADEEFLPELADRLAERPNDAVIVSGFAHLLMDQDGEIVTNSGVALKTD